MIHPLSGTILLRRVALKPSAFYDVSKASLVYGGAAYQFAKGQSYQSGQNYGTVELCEKCLPWAPSNHENALFENEHTRESLLANLIHSIARSSYPS